MWKSFNILVCRLSSIYDREAELMKPQYYDCLNLTWTMATLVGMATFVGKSINDPLIDEEGSYWLLLLFFLINSIQCRVRWDYTVVSIFFYSGLVWAWPLHIPVYFSVWSPVGGCWGRIERYAVLGEGVFLGFKQRLQKPPLYS